MENNSEAIKIVNLDLKKLDEEIKVMDEKDVELLLDTIEFVLAKVMEHDGIEFIGDNDVILN